MEIGFTTVGTVTPSQVRAAVLNFKESDNGVHTRHSVDENDRLKSVLKRGIHTLVFPSVLISSAVNSSIVAFHKMLGTEDIAEWNDSLFVDEAATWRIPSTFLKTMSRAYPQFEERPEHAYFHRGNTALALSEKIFDHALSGIRINGQSFEYMCICGMEFDTDSAFEQHGFLKLQEAGLVFGSAVELVAQARTLTNIAKAMFHEPSKDRESYREFHHAADILSMELVMLHAPSRD